MTQDLIARIIATKTQASEYALAYDKLDDAAARNAWAGVANLLSDILNDHAGRQMVREQQRKIFFPNASDLAIIGMDYPDTTPLETGVSDFGFVNKFDASGRSLSGGDIA